MSNSAPANVRSQPTGAGNPPETIKDTLISIVIAFTMAFVFRGFVIEAFVIPTGSMAPTLMGAHVRFHGKNTGHDWALGPIAARGNDPTNYNPIQHVGATDPISGEQLKEEDRTLSTGDRILVLKYLYAIQSPKRFDVIVFKNPTNPSENYIKRLIGLPGEQIALVDGDVFVRTDPTNMAPQSDDPARRAALWSQPGWHVARKSDLAQRDVWQTVFDSSFSPLNFSSEKTPWRPDDDKSWTMTGRSYRFTGQGTGRLSFDTGRARSELGAKVPLRWAIDDYYPYDETMYRDPRTKQYPVSDVRVRFGITPERDGVGAALVLNARGHEFRARIDSGKSEIAWRVPEGEVGIKGEWKVVATADAPALVAGKGASIEFWHVDQSVQIWMNDTLLCKFEYDWSPAERLRFATGKDLVELIADQPRSPTPNLLASPNLYLEPKVTLQFTGGPLTLDRVGLDRDLHYQPNQKQGISALATSPYAPLILSPDQFFACGDNSPASSDGRLWESVDPWVNREFPPPPGPYESTGVVPRDLLLGKAFFVYWPSVNYGAKPLPVPDFGRMRFIW